MLLVWALNGAKSFVSKMLRAGEAIGVCQRSFSRCEDVQGASYSLAFCRVPSCFLSLSTAILHLRRPFDTVHCHLLRESKLTAPATKSPSVSLFLSSTEDTGLNVDNMLVPHWGSLYRMKGIVFRCLYLSIVSCARGSGLAVVS